MTTPIQVTHKSSLMRWLDILSFLLCLLLIFSVIDVSAGSKVVIDAGHGGNETGSRAGSSVEKDWNLKFAKAIARALTTAGIDVMLVREKDETLSPEERSDRINKSDPAFVLVIHADRDLSGTRSGAMIVVQPPQGNADATGLQPWGWTPLTRQRVNVRLAKSLARAVGLPNSFSTLSDRSGCVSETLSWEGRILCAPHSSLRYLVVPAVVLTPMFMTSRSDIQLYSNDEAIDSFAVKVAQGVQAFLHTGSEENP